MDPIYDSSSDEAESLDDLAKEITRKHMESGVIAYSSIPVAYNLDLAPSRDYKRIKLIISKWTLNLATMQFTLESKKTLDFATLPKKERQSILQMATHENPILTSFERLTKFLLVDKATKCLKINAHFRSRK